MKHSALVLLAIVGLAAPAAFAQSGYTITGGLSNFDCGNHCDDPCDEFEIEIEGLHPEDIYHTYHNGNYGNPVITQDGTAVRIDYHNPAHLTPVGSIEHFGISLRNFSPATNTIRVRWMRNGATALVNGHEPIQGGGEAQNTQPILPTVTTQTAVDNEGNNVIQLLVTNNDTTQAIWVQRRVAVTAGEVTLEALMPNDPVVTGTFQIDASPVLLSAGATLATTGDLIELEDVQTAVFTATIFQDLFSGGPFGQQHVVGPQLVNLMTASVAAIQQCQDGGPTIRRQPRSVTEDRGMPVDVDVSVHDGDTDTFYEWRKDGVVITDSGMITGTDTDTITIAQLTPDTAGIYYVTVYNACGREVSTSAIVQISGDRGGNDHCRADYNLDGVVNSDDISDYVTNYFDDSRTAQTLADFNQDGVTNADDLGDYVTEYFNGCN